MNNREKYNDENLRQYISPENIEKAPEGFTSKVMTRIKTETIPLAVSGKSQKRNLVPVIYAAVTLFLLAAACLIPANESDSMMFTAFRLLAIIKSSLPELNLSSIFRLHLPSFLIYVFIGILVLTLFDRALFGIFHREK
jgi:hypothetical protein